MRLCVQKICLSVKRNDCHPRFVGSQTGKTGKIEDHIEQLEVYAALFCLEYKIKPGSIDTELRLYKQDEVLVHHPEVDTITHIMDRIIHLDKLLASVEGKEV